MIKKENKIIALFALYWQYTLDTILTHVFVIAFLTAGFATTAAILMSLDSLFKITLSVPVSRLINHISPSHYGRISIILRFLLITIWFLAVSFLLNGTSEAPILLYVLFKSILLIDANVSAEFIFLLRKQFSIDLTKTVAAQNILIRASTAIAPALALIILASNLIGAIIFISALIIFIYSVIALRSVFFSLEGVHLAKRTSLPFVALLKNSYMRWGLMYQILGNLAFAGVSFILLKELKPHAHIFFNEITMLYSSFLLLQIVIIFLGDAVVPIKNIPQVALIMALCGLSVFLAGVSHAGAFRLFFCILIGFTYSLSVSGIQKVITANLHGPGYLGYIGWAQMAGRSCSFLVTMALGYAITMNIGAQSLLMFCGVFGIVASGLLYKLPVNVLMDPGVRRDDACSAS